MLLNGRTCDSGGGVLEKYIIHAIHIYFGLLAADGPVLLRYFPKNRINIFICSAERLCGRLDTPHRMRSRLRVQINRLWAQKCIFVLRELLKKNAYMTSTCFACDEGCGCDFLWVDQSIAIAHRQWGARKCCVRACVDVHRMCQDAYKTHRM